MTYNGISRFISARIFGVFTISSFKHFPISVKCIAPS